MFDGEKSNLFWVGLFDLAVAFLFLFTSLWQIMLNYITFRAYSSQCPSSFAYNFVGSYVVPIVAGAVTFMLIGVYMMKCGVKKVQASQP